MPRLPRLFPLLLPGLLLLALPAHAAPDSSSGSQAAPTGDAAIRAAVMQRLQEDPRLSEARLDVNASNGIVRIRGDIPDPDLVDELLDLAETTDGVRGVFVTLNAD